MGRINILSKTKQSKNKKPIFGFDIETYDDNKKFLMASLYGENYKKFFYSKEEFIKEIKTKARFRNSYIVATNLAFDFFGTFTDEKDLGKFSYLFRGSDLITAKTKLVYEDGKVEFHKEGKRGSNTLSFIDTMNFAKLSVDKMGKILQLPKLSTPSFIGEYPSSKEEWEEMKEYNLRDSEISYKFMKFLYDSFFELGASPKLTIASSAMSLFKNKYLDKDYFIHDEEVLLEQFKGYYGGRTESLARGPIKDYNYYDFNSLYPSVMVEELPDPNSMRMSYFNSKEFIEEYEGMSDVEIHCPKMDHPLLPVRVDGKLCFPTGNFRGYYCHNELREALAMGYTIKKVYKSFYYLHNCRPFKSYVNDLYNLRNEYKKEGNPMEYVVKILMNSLYGKFGQKFTDKENVVVSPTAEELTKYNHIDNVKGEIYRVVQDRVRVSNFCIPIWAAYITAKARIKLTKAMNECNPVYVDTDSLITKNEIATSNDLGDLKLEMTIRNGIIVKPKFYSVSGENFEMNKIKGVGTKIGVDLFDDILINKKVSYSKFTKFKEALRRDLIPNEIIPITKHMDLNDTKRDWEFPFNRHVLGYSKPIEVYVDENNITSRTGQDPEHGHRTSRQDSQAHANEHVTQDAGSQQYRGAISSDTR